MCLTCITPGVQAPTPENKANFQLNGQEKLTSMFWKCGHRIGFAEWLLVGGGPLHSIPSGQMEGSYTNTHLCVCLTVLPQLLALESVVSEYCLGHCYVTSRQQQIQGEAGFTHTFGSWPGFGAPSQRLRGMRRHRWWATLGFLFPLGLWNPSVCGVCGIILGLDPTITVGLQALP